MFPDVQLWEVVRIYLVFALPGILLWPVVRRAFPGMPDGGWAISRPVGAFVWAWLVWFPPSITPIPYGLGLIVVAGLGLSGVAGWLYWRDRRELIALWRHVVVVEIVFAVVLLLALAVAPYNGELNPRAERFMDFAFMSRLAVTRSFPPQDMWMAGKSVQYYYYGYVVMDCLRRLSGIELSRFFNYAVVANYASFAAAIYGAGLVLTRRRVVALIAAGVASLGANVHVWHSAIEDKTLLHTNWFGAARVIKGTITEFPLFSFFWGDLHPYVIAFPAVAACIAITAALLLRTESVPLGEPAPVGDAPEADTFPWSPGLPWGRRLSLCGPFLRDVFKAIPEARPPLRTAWVPLFLIAVLVGALFPTNSWDYPTLGLAVFGALFVATTWGVSKRPWTHRVAAGVVAAGVAGFLSVLLYLPFNLSFGAGQSGRGIMPVARRSDMLPFLEMWGVFFAGVLAWCLVRGRPRVKRWALPTALGVAVVVALFEVLARPSLLPVSEGLGGIGYRLTYSIFLAGHGWLIAIIIAYVLLDGLWPAQWRTPEGAARLAGLLALLVILTVEFLYLNDHYSGELERMNTVFKAYTQGWIILSVAVPALLVHAWLAASRRARWALGSWIAVSLLASSGYAAFGSVSRYGGFKRSTQGGPPTMDVLSNFRRTLAADAAVADWIEEHTDPDQVILEVPLGRDPWGKHQTNAYHWPGRMAAVTGRPTVIGWPNHEAGWRNSWKEPLARTADVEEIYKTPDLASAIERCRTYGVDFIYVGVWERRVYGRSDPEGLAKFSALPVAYAFRGASLYRVPPPSKPGESS